MLFFFLLASQFFFIIILSFIVWLYTLTRLLIISFYLFMRLPNTNQLFLKYTYDIMSVCTNVSKELFKTDTRVTGKNQSMLISIIFLTLHCKWIGEKKMRWRVKRTFPDNIFFLLLLSFILFEYISKMCSCHHIWKNILN